MKPGGYYGRSTGLLGLGGDNHQPIGRDQQGWYYIDRYRDGQKHYYSQHDKPTAGEMQQIPPSNPAAEKIATLVQMLSGLFGKHGSNADPHMVAAFMAHVAPLLTAATSVRKK